MTQILSESSAGHLACVGRDGIAVGIEACIIGMVFVADIDVVYMSIDIEDRSPHLGRGAESGQIIYDVGSDGKLTIIEVARGFVGSAEDIMATGFTFGRARGRSIRIGAARLA